MCWLEDLRDVVAEADRKCDGFAGTRDAVLGYWLAIADLPPFVRDRYRDIDEFGLDAAARDHELDSPMGFPVDGSTRARQNELLFTLAVRLRAAERRLFELSPGATARRPEDCLAGFRGRRAYVLLREARNRTCKRGDPFTRRGLRRARIIPAAVGGLEVGLVIAEDPRGRARLRAGAPLRVATGLFAGLELEIDEVGNGFLVRDARAPGQLSTVRGHLAAAAAQGCAGLIYPELSIGAGLLGDLRTCLSTRDYGLSFVLAGSRHRMDGLGRWYNVATVLDGYGGVLMEHSKLFGFLDRAGSPEAVEPGSRIDVLVLEEAVVAVATCLDFCIGTEESPYLSLDVDYVLVPSCGGPTTMRDHVGRSSQALLRQGSRAIVVQQHDPPGAGDPLGYVLARGGGPAPSVEELARTEDWHVCTL